MLKGEKMISWDFYLMVYVKFKDKTNLIYTVDINFKVAFYTNARVKDGSGKRFTERSVVNPCNEQPDPALKVDKLN